MLAKISRFTGVGRRELGMLILFLILCVVATFGTMDFGIEKSLIKFDRVVTEIEDGKPVEYLDTYGSMFAQPSNLRNQLKIIGMFGIFSIGVGLVIIAAGIDLSLGSLMALLGVIFFLILSSWGESLGLSLPVRAFLAVFVVLLLGTLFGVFHAFSIAWIGMPAFIVTLCGLLGYRGLARAISNETTVNTRGVEYPTLDYLCQGQFLGIPLPFLYLIGIALIAWVVLHHSVFGRYIFAVGRSEMATKYSGISSTKIIGSTYVICAFLTAISAILFCYYTGSVSPSVHGNFYELYGIAAAVLGGCSLRGGEGSIAGIVIGTAIIILIQNTVTLLGWPSAWEAVIVGGVIFIGVFVDLVLPKLSGAR